MSCAAIPVYYKDPDDTLDFSVSWATWLGADTISTSDWILPSGITEASSSNTTTAATIWLSGGTRTNTYQVTNRIVTAAGRTKDQTLKIVVVTQ